MTSRDTKVARIGKRYWRHAVTPHNSNWRMQLRVLAKWMLACIAVLFITTLVLAFMSTTNALAQIRSDVLSDVQKLRINNV